MCFLHLVARSAEGSWLELELEKFDPKSCIGASYVRFGLHTVFALRCSDARVGLSPNAEWSSSTARSAEDPMTEAAMREEGWDDSQLEGVYGDMC